jgi:thiamine pyrophosphate-dependent acetolactate synthase large subunit-like protein
MGMPGTRATTLDTFVRALLEGFQAEGPMLIEVTL